MVSHLALAAELLILFLFSSSQAKKPLILVHIEFNILAVEIIIVLLYLDLSLSFDRKCYFGKNSYISILILTLVAKANIYNGFKKNYNHQQYQRKSKKQRNGCKNQKHGSDLSDLNKDDGLDKSSYAKNTNTLAFMAYDKFENFRRYDLNIVDYINKYERLNNQIKHFDME